MVMTATPSAPTSMVVLPLAALPMASVLSENGRMGFGNGY